MEVFVAGFVLAVGVLVVLDEFPELLAVKFRDVLENHADVFRVEWPFVLFVVGGVLQDDGLAQEVD